MKGTQIVEVLNEETNSVFNRKLRYDTLVNIMTLREIFYPIHYDNLNIDRNVLKIFENIWFCLNFDNFAKKELGLSPKLSDYSTDLISLEKCWGFLKVLSALK
jgi:hypothetical protein